MRVVAQAEAAPNKPALFYVCDYKDARGKRQHITLGSTLDPEQPGALAAIATDIRARTGVTLHSYVVADITDILRDVRAAAKAQSFDFSGAFLPPLGDPNTVLGYRLYVLANVVLIGPPKLHEAMMDPQYAPKPYARLKVTSDDATGNRISRLPEYVLPKDVKVKDPTRAIEFRLAPREPQ